MDVVVTEIQSTSNRKDRHIVMSPEMAENWGLVMLGCTRTEHPAMRWVLLHGDFGGEQPEETPNITHIRRQAIDKFTHHQHLKQSTARHMFIC
jgi:hypothetical protein